MVRDMLAAEIPSVLRAQLYAVAALAGAAVVVIGDQLGLPALPITLTGAALCFGLRFLAIWREWRLPVAVTFSARRSEALSNAELLTTF